MFCNSDGRQIPPLNTDKCKKSSSNVNTSSTISYPMIGSLEKQIKVRLNRITVNVAPCNKK